MLKPGVVGVAGRRRTVLPAGIVSKLLAAPIGDVEWGFRLLL